VGLQNPQLFYQKFDTSTTGSQNIAVLDSVGNSSNELGIPQIKIDKTSPSVILPGTVPTAE